MTPMRIFSDLAVGRGDRPAALRDRPATSASSTWCGARPSRWARSRAALRRVPGRRAALCARRSCRVASPSCPTSAGKIVDAIIGLGMLKPVDVFRLLSEQVRQAVLETFGFHRGAGQLLPGRAQPARVVPAGAGPLRDPGRGGADPALEYLQRRFIVLRTCGPRAFESAPPQPGGVSPGPHAARAVEHAGRQPHGAGVADSFRTADEQVTFLRTLYLLIETGLAG